MRDDNTDTATYRAVLHQPKPVGGFRPGITIFPPHLHLGIVLEYVLIISGSPQE